MTQNCRSTSTPSPSSARPVSRPRITMLGPSDRTSARQCRQFFALDLFETLSTNPKAAVVCGVLSNPHQPRTPKVDNERTDLAIQALGLVSRYGDLTAAAGICSQD